MRFVNRTWELSEMDRWGKPGGMVVVYGRRRVGKTKLLGHWLAKKRGAYSQAIEGSRQLQIDQVMADLAPILKTELRPQNWSQFFELLGQIQEDAVICLDEFPYLVASDPSLTSILQKFWDHKKRNNLTLFLCGSSQKMMHSFFLNESSALYGRATRILKIEPMNYAAFCQATHLPMSAQDSFLKYSLVGGLPKYWEYVDKNSSAIDLADLLYFQSGAILEREPHRVLSDEKVDGLIPLSVLEAIGRGAHRSSEIGARLEAKQSSLSKILSQLQNASLIIREVPFGMSPKDSKKSLYKFQDPVLLFWFSVYSANRSLWQLMSSDQKQQHIYHHASKIFESEVRTQLKGQRYWSDKEEFDIVRPLQKKQHVQVVEVKFAKTHSKEKTRLLSNLENKVLNSTFLKDYHIEEFKVVGWGDVIWDEVGGIKIANT